MPHPAVVSGYEELLEVAEAILFSVPLPPGVIDKYKTIQAEVKARIRASVNSDREPLSSYSTADPAGAERALLHEKLAASKRKCAGLQEQLRVLEGQVSQLTTKIQALHAHHKSSLVEVQEQTRHACAESHARHLAELEARSRGDAGRERQVIEDQLAAERAFHASVQEKMVAIAAMFPEAYGNMTDSVSAALNEAMALGESRNAHHPNSASRLQLTTFFESTRRALNTARHTVTELRTVEKEHASARLHRDAADEWRYTAQKSLDAVERQADALSEECRRMEEERAAIMQRMSAAESRRHAAVLAAERLAQVDEPVDVEEPPAAAAASNKRDRLSPPARSSAASRTSPSNLRGVTKTAPSATTADDDTTARRPTFRSQASVERSRDSEEEDNDEASLEHDNVPSRAQSVGQERKYAHDDIDDDEAQHDAEEDAFNRTIAAYRHAGPGRHSGTGGADLPPVAEESETSAPSTERSTSRRPKQ